MQALIVKTSALGDIIQAFDALNYLHQSLPTLAIDWVVEAPFQSLVAAHPSVRRVIAIESKKWRKHPLQHRHELASCLQTLRSVHYDWLWDLQGNTKSAIITALCHAKQKIGFGKKSVAEWPSLLASNRRYDPPPQQNMREDYLFLIKQTLSSLGYYAPSTTALVATQQEKAEVSSILAHPFLQGSLFLICPASRWLNKQLPFNTWKELLGKISKAKTCSFLFLWGSQEEKKVALALQQTLSQQSIVLPHLSLSALQHLMTHITCVLSVDSMALHLAATTATPTFSFFGASSAHKYQPLGPQHHAMQGSCPYQQTFEKRCKRLRTCPTGACMHNLSADELFQTFMKSPF